MKPPAPTCIADAIRAKCTKHSFGVISGPDPGVYDWKPGQVAIDVLAQAVWDALLNEGHIRYAIGQPEELGRWIVPTFDTSNRHGRDWCKVLVVPVGRDPQTPHADA